MKGVKGNKRGRGGQRDGEMIMVRCAQSTLLPSALCKNFPCLCPYAIAISTSSADMCSRRTPAALGCLESSASRGRTATPKFRPKDAADGRLCLSAFTKMWVSSYPRFALQRTPPANYLHPLPFSILSPEGLRLLWTFPQMQSSVIGPFVQSSKVEKAVIRITGSIVQGP